MHLGPGAGRTTGFILRPARCISQCCCAAAYCNCPPDAALGLLHTGAPPRRQGLSTEWTMPRLQRFWASSVVKDVGPFRKRRCRSANSRSKKGDHMSVPDIIAVNDGRIRVRVDGSSEQPAILLLHG